MEFVDLLREIIKKENLPIVVIPLTGDNEIKHYQFKCSSHVFVNHWYSLPFHIRYHRDGTVWVYQHCYLGEIKYNLHSRTTLEYIKMEIFWGYSNYQFYSSNNSIAKTWVSARFVWRALKGMIKVGYYLMRDSS